VSALRLAILFGYAAGAVGAAVIALIISHQQLLLLCSCISIADFRGMRVWNLHSHALCLDLPLGAIR
jgi:hypothetical protein